MIRIAVVGAAGRMGQAIGRLASESEDIRLEAAIVRPGSPLEGEAVPHARGLAYTSEVESALAGVDVVLDFSAPDRGQALVEHCLRQGCALLVGTTGLDAQARQGYEEAARRIPVLLAPNTSMGVNLLLDLVRRAASALGEDYDIEVIEAHHGRKVDAPSGTALRLGEEAAEARGTRLEDAAVYQRQGQTGARRPGDIGFAVVRGGDIAGEHTVMFAGPGERIELSHRASSRDTFARGALGAARWLAGRPAGLYAMSDVLDGA